MTDDQLREACARARGWREWGFPGEGNAKIWLDANDNPHRWPPPLDGNTALALLELCHGRANVYIDTTAYYAVRVDTSKLVHRSPKISARNVILAALLALGEISAEDVTD